MLERLTLAHLAQIVEIENACFSSPWSAAQLSSAINNPRYQCYALTSGDLTGFAIFSLLLEEAELLQIAIAPSQQKRGLASEFLTELQAALNQQGVTRILLEVRQSNAAALRLYQKLGFIEDGRRKAYYPPEAENQQREDAILMSHSLPA